MELCEYFSKNDDRLLPMLLECPMEEARLIGQRIKDGSFSDHYKRGSGLFLLVRDDQIDSFAVCQFSVIEPPMISLLKSQDRKLKHHVLLTDYICDRLKDEGYERVYFQAEDRDVLLDCHFRFISELTQSCLGVRTLRALKRSRYIPLADKQMLLMDPYEEDGREDDH